MQATTTVSSSPIFPPTSGSVFICTTHYGNKSPSTDSPYFIRVPEHCCLGFSLPHSSKSFPLCNSLFPPSLAQVLPTRPSLALFDGQLPMHEICTRIPHWVDVIPTPTSTHQHLVVNKVSLIKQRAKEFQHEFLRIEVLNRNTW